MSTKECPACGGDTKCTSCRGRGERTSGIFTTKCGKCGGTGNCTRCKGQGVVPAK